MCNPVSLEIFEAWYALGGSQHPPSIVDLAVIPAWLRRDFMYIFSEISDVRKRVKAAKKAKAATKRKPRK